MSHIGTDPPVNRCACKISKCDKGTDYCTLQSPEHSCYTIIRRFFNEKPSFEKGCMERCTEYHNSTEKRTCCYGNYCNNEIAIPSVFPSPSSTVVAPTKTSYAPPLLTEGTTATPAPPTNKSRENKNGPIKQLLCYCSNCVDGSKTCVSEFACGSVTIESQHRGWCVDDEYSCENSAHHHPLNCCYKDYCNDPPVRPTSPGPPCDDEDSESSGGCDYGKIML